jgi:hypothetical protein
VSGCGAGEADIGRLAEAVTAIIRHSLFPDEQGRG